MGSSKTVTVCNLFVPILQHFLDTSQCSDDFCKKSLSQKVKSTLFRYSLQRARFAKYRTVICKMSLKYANSVLLYITQSLCVL